MMATEKEILTKKLGEILGFEDGAEDILDHLLTIESGEDLLDYISQLLGSRDEKVQKFAEDVGRFQRGETIEEGNVAESKKEEKPRSSISKLTPLEKKPAAPKKPSKGTKAASSKSVSQAVTKSKPAPKTPQVRKEPKKTPPSKKEEPRPTKKVHPPRGKAKFNCGCFGNYHKPLTNCLYCGRVSCEKEGYDYCPFCGYLVEEVKPPKDLDTAEYKAWKHKERLLRYDREFARRTVILDDQADYFSSQAGQWLSEEERHAAKEREEERQKELHERKKMQLNIAL